MSAEEDGRVVAYDAVMSARRKIHQAFRLSLRRTERSEVTLTRRREPRAHLVQQGSPNLSEVLETLVLYCREARRYDIGRMYESRPKDQSGGDSRKATIPGKISDFY